MSSRVDFLPQEYIAELSQLPDSVPPHDFTGIKKQLSGALGAPPEDLFYSFDETPIAAASLDQIHEAVLRNGRKVAAKIRYPEIDKILETDIMMFYLLIRYSAADTGGINLDILHAEFSKIVSAELDYIEEGKNAERFRAYYRDGCNVLFPSVKWEYTRNKVLTLEYFSRIKITDCGTIRSAGLW